MDDRSLYQAILGLSKPWEVTGVDLRLGEGEVQVRVEVDGNAVLQCPECGVDSPRYDQSVERRWRHLDTCQYRTMVVGRVPRVKCAEHGVRQIAVKWAEDRSRFTALFEAFAIRVLRECSLSAAAELLGLTWEEIAGIQRRAVLRGLARRKVETVRVIGIDETSFQKRHEYITVAIDLERDRVLWVGDQRREATLLSFWESRPPEELARLEAVVMDMWDPYIAATRKGIADGLSKLVFDRYHVMWHLNQAVDEVRKAEQRELRRNQDAAAATLLKGTRFLWLRGKATREARHNRAIDQLRRAGLKVGRAWAIKESATRLWAYKRLSAAKKFFARWYWWATHSRLPSIVKAAKTLKSYLYGILAFTRFPYTNARTEAVNAKIQEIKYRARGYRNRDNFRMAILFHCGGLDMDPR